MIKRRKHLDHTVQPKEGWRTVPFNGYYEAHPTGLIRNKVTQKLIKGTQTRKNHHKWTAHEIVYLINPKKTTYSRGVVIAHTFPELISQSRGDLKNGHVCFKDGDRSNCHVDNMFIGKGNVNKNIYKLNDSYLTRKDIEEDINNLVNERLFSQLELLIKKNEPERITPSNHFIKRNNNVFSITDLTKNSLVEFELEIKNIK